MKLKKVMSFVIAGVIAASAAMTALAEEGSVSFTPDEVVEWLHEGDEKAEDVNGQILNGVSRLAEMLLIVDVAAGPDEEQMGTVNALLNDVASCEGSEDLDVLQKTGILAAGTVHALDVFVDAIDEGDGRGASVSLANDWFDLKGSAEVEDNCSLYLNNFGL